MLQSLLRDWRAAGLAMTLIAVLACQPSEGDSAGHNESVPTPASALPCDSAQAARVALDSLEPLDAFTSAIARYELGSAGIRIVTRPAPGQAILDGAAIIHLDPACRITSLVQTDSA